jgi:hypothetical protein
MHHSHASCHTVKRDSSRSSNHLHIQSYFPSSETRVKPYVAHLNRNKAACAQRCESSLLGIAGISFCCIFIAIFDYVTWFASVVLRFCSYLLTRSCQVETNSGSATSLRHQRAAPYPPGYHSRSVMGSLSRRFSSLAWAARASFGSEAGCSVLGGCGAWLAPPAASHHPAHAFGCTLRIMSAIPQERAAVYQLQPIPVRLPCA